MQTDNRQRGSLDAAMPATTGFLSLAVTALRLTAPLPKDRIVDLEEVAWHDNAKDCWVVIYDRVYDLTRFLDEHPGGRDVLLEYAGRDATVAFRGVGHSAGAIRALDRYQVGELPVHERIFRKTGGIRLTDIPA